MSDEGDRIRMVIMGDTKVGKTSILKRFINNTFQVKHTEKVFIFVERKCKKLNSRFASLLRSLWG